MRGKVLLARPILAPLRITPAYAGKSLARRCVVPRSRDHPRVCGEKLPSVHIPVCRLGSPPRMRGKVFLGAVVGRAGGITPAYAGKSTRLLIQQLSLRDHPRVCGEKFRFEDVSRTARGSPPRMRGKDVWCRERADTDGITPAYAGKRLKRSHSIGHFSCILCLFHSVLHRASVSGGSRAGPCAPPCLPAQNAVPV